jgi:hypothetical protein
MFTRFLISSYLVLLNLLIFYFFFK